MRQGIREVDPAQRHLHDSRTKPNIDWLLLIIFSLTLIAFAAVGTRYLSIVFDHITRFVMLALLLLIVVWRGYICHGFSGAFGVWTLSYLAWTCVTISWSQVPELSASKAILQLLVACTFISAGYAWTRKSSPEHAFDIFAGMTLLAAVVGILGAAVTATTIDTGSTVLYRGLAYNPNTLGIIVIMSVPWTVWFFQANYQKKMNRRILAYLMLVSVLVVLLLTNARSSIFSVGLIGVIYLYYAGFGRYASVIVLFVLVGFVIYIAVPDLTEQIVSVVTKGANEHSDIFHSRRQVWEDSWTAAEQGDLFGVGFGVSVGFTEFSGGFSAAGYGREKGNSTLAILEELGQAGLILYALMLFSFFARLMSAATRVPSKLLRAQLGLVIGTIVGLIASSQFEAWFVAPSAPASPFFWSLVGCGLALAHKAEQLAQAKQASLQMRISQ